MPDEILNIEHHTRRLVLKAVAWTSNEAEAAKLLDVSERTVPRLKRKYGMWYDHTRRVYMIGDEPNPYTKK